MNLDTREKQHIQHMRRKKKKKNFGIFFHTFKQIRLVFFPPDSLQKKYKVGNIRCDVFAW